MRQKEGDPVPPSVIRLCGGLLMTFRDSLLSEELDDAVNVARKAFLHLPSMGRYRSSCRKSIMEAVEETLTTRVSFYTLQRRWDLPIDEAGKFTHFRDLYCNILMDRLCRRDNAPDLPTQTPK